MIELFDLLIDGMIHAVNFLAAIPIGSITLADFLIVIFIMSLLVTVFLNVVDTGGIVATRKIYERRFESRRRKGK